MQGELNGVGLSVRGACLQNFMVLNKLSKAATGKTNKAYANTAPFSKIRLWTCLLSEIFIAKIANTFKFIQIQQERSIKCFYFLVSEKYCYHGSDWDTTVCCCFSLSIQFVFEYVKSQAFPKLRIKRLSRFLSCC